jgi:diacylglycerol diphosphate phosphatase/phosphatidate phosphatase
VAFANGNIVYSEFAYPLRKEIVPIRAAALLAALVPIVIILIMQIRIRSFWDINNAILGLLYSLITATVFQVMLKCLIGGLRPHFLAVCDPDVPPFGQQAGTGWTQIMYNRSICRGDKDKIDDSLESFPSGHSTAAFAGFIFLFLYLNAKLKAFANYHPSYWKLIAVYTPVLGATLIAGALTINDFHNFYDVVAGAIIGTTMAVSAYRMVYASVWDFRFNHVPVARDAAFGYGVAQKGHEGFREAVATRKAGWGAHEGHVFGGAPFDAIPPPAGSVGVPATEPAASGAGTGASPAGGTADAGAGAGARSRRFGMRARSADGGAGVGENQPGAEKLSRRPIGAGMFRRGDENVWVSLGWLILWWVCGLCWSAVWGKS